MTKCKVCEIPQRCPVFNIGLKPVPICESCADTITIQQVVDRVSMPRIRPRLSAIEQLSDECLDQASRGEKIKWFDFLRQVSQLSRMEWPVQSQSAKLLAEKRERRTDEPDGPGYSLHKASCPYEHGGACICQ